MTQQEVKQQLQELGMDETMLFENPSYETAIIGISNDDRVIYDYEKMIQYLVDTDNMEEDEAVEFIEYNTLRAIPYFGDKAPIVSMFGYLFNNNE